MLIGADHASNVSYEFVNTFYDSRQLLLMFIPQQLLLLWRKWRLKQEDCLDWSN